MPEFLKSAKFWGSIAGILLMILGLITGTDVKKYVCEPLAPAPIVVPSPIPS